MSTSVTNNPALPSGAVESEEGHTQYAGFTCYFIRVPSVRQELKSKQKHHWGSANTYGVQWELGDGSIADDSTWRMMGIGVHAREELCSR